ncbi:MAG: PaaI family thioesterase [Bacteroidetes bacterium]|nr:MAG: PaaI family thioesterase [Bacteroidota bacterium]
MAYFFNFAAMSDVFPPETIERWNNSHFWKWAGIHILEVKSGWARAEIQVQPHHRGGGGTQAVNGGIMAYFFDGLLSAAARTVARENFLAMSTVNLNVSYLRLLQVESRVEGIATVIRAGGSTVFLEGKLYDDQGEICATCNGIIRLFYKK